MKTTDRDRHPQTPANASPSFDEELQAFLATWHDESETVWVQTSGSTGAPKPMQVEKRRMEASARLTCEFLGLQAGETALLCMPLKYIAGKMMVVRSLVGGLRLLPVTPSGHPLAQLETAPDFAAMIPMQVYNSLRVSHERHLLQQIRHLIIGGGAIDAQLEEELKGMPGRIWSTYGMTETLSHIAMRRLNGEEATEWYTPLPGVEVTRSEAGTLVIYAPRVCQERLVTNDVAQLDAKGRFRILGRRDNIINSGGVKIQAEEVEEQLRPYLNPPFLVTAAPDERLGETIVLLIEGSQPDNLEEIMTRTLSPYHRPRHIGIVERLPLTETGKPDRAAAKRIASTLSSHTDA